MGLIDRTTITATAFTAQPDRLASATVDGSETGTDYWYSYGVAPTTADWIKWDLGSSKTIAQVVWSVYDATPQYHPPAGVVEVSTDDSTWTQVATWSSGEFNSSLARYSVSFTSVSARYVRLRPSANASAAWVIREVYIYTGAPVLTASPLAAIINFFSTNNLSGVMPGATTQSLYSSGTSGTRNASNFLQAGSVDLSGISNGAGGGALVTDRHKLSSNAIGSGPATFVDPAGLTVNAGSTVSATKVGQTDLLVTKYQAAHTAGLTPLSVFPAWWIEYLISTDRLICFYVGNDQWVYVAQVRKAVGGVLTVEPAVGYESLYGDPASAPGNAVFVLDPNGNSTPVLLGVLSGGNRVTDAGSLTDSVAPLVSLSTLSYADLSALVMAGWTDLPQVFSDSMSYPDGVLPGTGGWTPSPFNTTGNIGISGGKWRPSAVSAGDAPFGASHAIRLDSAKDFCVTTTWSRSAGASNANEIFGIELADALQESILTLYTGTASGVAANQALCQLTTCGGDAAPPFIFPFDWSVPHTLTLGYVTGCHRLIACVDGVIISNGVLSANLTASSLGTNSYAYPTGTRLFVELDAASDGTLRLAGGSVTVRGFAPSVETRTRNRFRS